MSNSTFRIILLVFVAALLIVGGPVSCRKGLVEKPTIAGVKSEKWREYLDKTVTLEGYFVDRPVPMLLSSMEVIQVNAPMPEGDYFRLSGAGIKGLPPEKYYGAFVSVTGTVKMSTGSDLKLTLEKFGQVAGLELICPEPPEIIRVPPQLIEIPRAFDFCRLYPRLCEKPPLFFPRKFALLLSGGANSWNAHMRYWNDLKFMYLTLRNKYGFSDNNIIVVYKDGTAEDADMTVDFAANTAGLQNAFNDLQTRMGGRDMFFFFATNHGGGFLMEESNAVLRGGRVDQSGDETDEAIFEEHLAADLNADGDQTDQVRHDQVVYLYNSAQDLWDDDLAAMLNQLRYDKMAILLEPCFSGGLLADLRGNRRVIASACSGYEYSWSGAPGNHDMFSYWFTCALAGQTHTGDTVMADTNGDGKVSMLEAFLYAQKNDSANETPFYEDNGDGRGHVGPFPVDGDGGFGATFFLD